MNLYISGGFNSRLQLFLIGAVAFVGLFGAYSAGADNSVDGGSVVMAVQKELETRGIDLVLVHLPMRYELYSENETPHDRPRTSLHPTTLQAIRENLRLRMRGIRTVNLHRPLLKASSSEDIYKDNRFHLKETAANKLGKELAVELRSQGVLWRDDGPSEVVFVGDCFGHAFAEAAMQINSTDRIRSLIKFGGGGQAHNHLFAFEDEYLEGTDTVVWVLGDRNLCGQGFEPLNIAHAHEDLESEIVEARIVKTTKVTKEQVRRMPYPNATRATLFERVDTGEQFIGVDYIALNRKLQTSLLFEENFRVQLSLLPLTSFERVHRDVAREYLIDDLDDFETPRYWVQGWLDLRRPEVVQITLE